MANTIKVMAPAEEKIVSRIYLVRGKKVMLDYDLSELYAVDTKQLKRYLHDQIRHPQEVSLHPGV